MPRCLDFPLPFAIWLLAVPAAAMASPVSELPGGGDAAFRTRMMAWSEPAPEPMAVPTAPALPDRPAQSDRIEALRLPRLSSRFGYRLHPIRHVRAMHAGIDIPGPMGTPVLASAGGVVRFAGGAGGYGEMVEIDHGQGLATRYAHLSRILVRPGSGVIQGQEIALMGSTGRSTGSHLHFEVRANGRAADPLAYLGPQVGPNVDRGGAGPLAAAAAVRYTPNQAHISQFARSRAATGLVLGDGSLATTQSLP